jgi:hypothetical protein
MTFTTLLTGIYGLLMWIGYALMTIGIIYNTIKYITAETPTQATEAKNALIKTVIAGILIFSAYQIITWILP